MALVDLQQTVEDLDASLSSIENVLDPEAKKAEIADLERQVAVPNLWDDQENAQRVTSRLSALQAELNVWSGCARGSRMSTCCWNSRLLMTTRNP